MKKLIIALFAILPMLVLASGGGAQLDHAGNDLTDKESLKRGFKSYINYCLGCHQLQYQRYNRTFADLGISDKDGMANWMYTGEKVGDHITNTMPAADAAKWFGSAPPDLTLEARLRSPDWIYTYLRSFYVDPDRPFGVNNTIFKDVGMPHVLQDLQGIQELTDEAKHMLTLPLEEQHSLSSADLVLVEKGTMTVEEFDKFSKDLSNFFEYVAEPSKLTRESMGKSVLIYLFIFFIFAYFLKKEYWKDVH